jgi:hypothetical protein
VSANLGLLPDDLANLATLLPLPGRLPHRHIIIDDFDMVVARLLLGRRRHDSEQLLSVSLTSPAV